MRPYVLTMSKNGHHFIIVYESGQEKTVLDTLTEMSQKRLGGFDWFDAAVLSHKLGGNIATELTPLMKKVGEQTPQ